MIKTVFSFNGCCDFQMLHQQKVKNFPFNHLTDGLAKKVVCFFKILLVAKDVYNSGTNIQMSFVFI